MVITIPEHRVKRTAKRLQKVLDCLGIDLNSPHASNSPRGIMDSTTSSITPPRSQCAVESFDEFLSGNDFATRDEFQMKALEAAGLGAVAGPRQSDGLLGQAFAPARRRLRRLVELSQRQVVREEVSYHFFGVAKRDSGNAIFG